MTHSTEQQINDLLQEKRYDDVLTIIQDKAKELGDKRVRFLKATVLIKQGVLEKAAELLKKNIRRYPDHSDSLLNYSVLLWQLGKHDLAIEYATKARDADQEDLHTHRNLVDMLMALKDKKRGLTALLTLLEHYEGFIPALKLTATIYIERSEWIKAKYYIDLMETYEPATSKDAETLRSLLPFTD